MNDKAASPEDIARSTQKHIENITIAKETQKAEILAAAISRTNTTMERWTKIMGCLTIVMAFMTAIQLYKTFRP